MKTDVDYDKNFEGQVLQKFFIDRYQTGSCSFICTNKLRHCQDIVVYNVVISGQRYTHPLIIQVPLPSPSIRCLLASVLLNMSDLL